jgi:hypothetical protein
MIVGKNEPLIDTVYARLRDLILSTKLKFRNLAVG